MAEILDTLWCELHKPRDCGSEDARILAWGYLSGSGEAGGDDNRRWCEIVHGARPSDAG